LRALELLGRAQILADLESMAVRSSLPDFAEPRATLARAVELADKPGGSDARPAAARALLELAALYEIAGGGGDPVARRQKALALAPFSVEAALALADEAGGEQGVSTDLAARSLEATAKALDDPRATEALLALAGIARGGPSSAAAQALDAAAHGCAGGGARGAFGLALARLSLGSGRPAESTALEALGELRRSGAFDAILFDRGRERTAFARHAESYLIHAVATARAAERHPIVTPHFRGSVGEVRDGLSEAKASLGRGDAPLAVRAFDLALALRPTLSIARRERAIAAAQVLRGDRPDLVPETQALAPSAALSHALVGRAGGALAFARVAVTALEGAEPPAEPLAKAELALARGRLLVAAGTTVGAIEAFETARATSEELLAELRKEERPTYPRLAAVLGVHSGALSDLGLAVAGATQDGADRDLAERGDAILDAVLSSEQLGVLDEQAGDFGVEDGSVTARCIAARAVTREKLKRAPLCADAFSKCTAGELTTGSVVAAYVDWHRLFELRGTQKFEPIVLRKEFGPHFRKEGGLSRLTVEDVSAEVKGAPPYDPAAPLARASRTLYGLPTGSDATARLAALHPITDDLDRAESLAPGFAAIAGFRALADLAAGQVENARSRFARIRELHSEDLGTKWIQLFEASSYGRFGFHDDARRVLLELRDGQKVDHGDSVAIRGEAFDDVREYPDLVPIVQEIDRLFIHAPSDSR
jgi:hypothetical protein